MKKEFNLHLYAVTDRHWLRGRTLASQVREVLEGGATIVQIREKHLGDVDFLEEAREIQSICGEFNVPLIINDNVEVARAIGAGLHVGQGDTACRGARGALGPDAIIGVSCSNVEEAQARRRMPPGSMKRRSGKSAGPSPSPLSQSAASQLGTRPRSLEPALPAWR